MDARSGQVTRIVFRVDLMVRRSRLLALKTARTKTGLGSSITMSSTSSIKPGVVGGESLGDATRGGPDGELLGVEGQVEAADRDQRIRLSGWGTGSESGDLRAIANAPRPMTVRNPCDGWCTARVSRQS
jgi:hypothetical protein